MECSLPKCKNTKGKRDLCLLMRLIRNFNCVRRINPEYPLHLTGNFWKSCKRVGCKAIGIGRLALTAIERRVMGRLIPFYIPEGFKPQRKWLPASALGRILQFRPAEVKQSA